MQRPNLRPACAALALLFTAAAWAAADDITRTSPDPSQSPPTSRPAPGAEPINPTSMALTPIRAADVARAVRSFLGEESQAHEGFCRINDPVDNATLDLRLKDVYADKLMKVDRNTFVTCATLETSKGITYDVDFYVKGTTRQNLKVVDATIHAKNGLQRYAWADEKGWSRVRAISSEMPLRGELAH